MKLNKESFVYSTVSLILILKHRANREFQKDIYLFVDYIIMIWKGFGFTELGLEKLKELEDRGGALKQNFLDMTWSLQSWVHSTCIRPELKKGTRK